MSASIEKISTENFIKVVTEQAELMNINRDLVFTIRGNGYKRLAGRICRGRCCVIFRERGYSYPAIAKRFRLDHTTIINTLKHLHTWEQKYADKTLKLEAIAQKKIVDAQKKIADGKGGLIPICLNYPAVRKVA